MNDPSWLKGKHTQITFSNQQNKPSFQNFYTQNNMKNFYTEGLILNKHKKWIEPKMTTEFKKIGWTFNI